MKEIISKAQKIVVNYDNQEYNIKNIKQKIMDLLDGAYFSPSYVTIEQDIVDNARKEGLWIELFFNELKSYKDYTFEKLLIQIKPKYNFVTLMRGHSEYNGKCIGLNLATNTSDFYKEIIDAIEGNNNEK